MRLVPTFYVGTHPGTLCVLSGLHTRVVTIHSPRKFSSHIEA